ncbi:hypothetical protein Q7C_2014 [Methylophaga frappieri]|uniref:SAM-dependent methyltransferase, MidA family n=1 Tax=Methylophaga frappieri (strain ATCC BAA-2434 / DSM 25690 / JAM7) TaxID=754477 RepID=I1YJR1_METFJ|nr:SAM-dependent methyltransferase [Methylophaga frappieri]AFJ03154.1 hypothetical protein Q7C_2014 [Methylophaga frappieri]
MTQTHKLPLPDIAAQQLSMTLQQHIQSAIHQHNGWLRFDLFMQHCLYYPGLGYYQNTLPKLGAAGDFVTAAEISPLYAATFANHIAEVLIQTTGDCLEFGAGSGQFAVDLLKQLQQRQHLPKRYFILETSATLQQRQRQLIHQQIPALIDRVHWLAQLPDNFTGAIIANEVCDAMPVRSFQIGAGQIVERGIGLIGQGELAWQTQPVQDAAILASLQAVSNEIPNFGFITEVNQTALAWVNTLAERLAHGAIFIADYGYPFQDYFHVSRAEGGIHCHYRHQVHDDVFFWPGLQDITAHLNFSELAEAAYVAGLTVSAFQTQRDFLISGEILTLIQSEQPTLAQVAALKQLLLPNMMGERFKVLTLTREIALPRLQQGDQRQRLASSYEQ